MSGGDETVVGNLDENLETIPNKEQTGKAVVTFGEDRKLEKSCTKFAENTEQNNQIFSRGSELRFGFRSHYKSRLGTIHRNKEFLERTRLQKRVRTRHKRHFRLVKFFYKHRLYQK